MYTTECQIYHLGKVFFQFTFGSLYSPWREKKEATSAQMEQPRGHGGRTPFFCTVAIIALPVETLETHIHRGGYSYFSILLKITSNS